MKISIYKYLIIFILYMCGCTCIAQSTDSIRVLHYGYDTELYDSHILSEVSQKQRILKKHYSGMLEEAIDSCAAHGGDLVRVTKYIDDDVITYGSEIFVAELVKTDPNHRDAIYSSIDSITHVRSSNRSFFQKLLGIYPQTHKPRHSPLVSTLRSIPADSIHNGILDVGGGVNLDFIILMANLNTSADLYFLNHNKVKLSLSHRSGVVLGIAPAMWIYTAPAIKYQQNISNVWIALSYGREYGRIYYGGDQESENYQMDHRIDVGLRVYKEPRGSVEFYIPFRIGDRFPLSYTGVGFNVYYRL